MNKDNIKMNRGISLTYICIAVLVVVEAMDLFFLIHNPRPAYTVQCISVLAAIAIGIWAIRVQRRNIATNARIKDLENQIMAVKERVSLIQEKTKTIERAFEGA
jgi:hypothetical protein